MDMKNAKILLPVLVGICAALIIFGGYKKGVESLQPQPVMLDKALFYNEDSLLYYMYIAEVFDDPKALFVTGMASRLRFIDPDFPKDLPTLPHPEPEGAYMIIRAAELGYEDAIKYIKCQEAHGCWEHVLPRNMK